MNLRDIKLLALCDSPTITTGFSRVANNLLARFPISPNQIHVWGIGFDGTHYDRSPWKVFPAGHPWYSPKALSAFLQLVLDGGYTHLWMMQDLPLLSQAGFPAALRQATARGVRTSLYFPIDSQWIPSDWPDILGFVEAAAAYTDFGKSVVENAMARKRRKAEGGMRKENPAAADAPPPVSIPQSAFRLPHLRVLPHGINPAIYHTGTEDRAELREKLWKWDGEPWLKPDDFLLLNVNVHQRRKDVGRSLEILAGLCARGVPAKLVLHMAKQSEGRVDLETLGEQLGLTLGVEWLHHDDFFHVPFRSTVSEKELARLYHAADLLLTTTLGEGWGLSITEALACGCPVALPLHTSCAEIYSRLHDLAPHWAQTSLVPLPCMDQAPALDADWSLLRPRVTLDPAVQRIAGAVHPLSRRPRSPLPAPVQAWLDWDRIAADMWQLVVGSESELGKPEGGKA